jgi:endonuclease/exonuclease/phosphatase family metal-dependent hydrolase
VNPNKIRVLTYNVRAFNRYNWVDKREVDDQIWELIKKYKPDIICFQEFYIESGSKHSMDGLLKHLYPLKYYPAFYSYDGHTPANFGIAVFSRYPIIKKNKLTFKNTHNMSMYVDVVAGRKTIRVYNNHLQSIQFLKRDYDFVDTMKLYYDEKNRKAIERLSIRLKKAFEMRARQVEEISGHICQSPYPVIVCGDFNDTPVSYTYRKMKGSLKDAFRAAGSGTSKTYIGKFPSYRIDYIFYNKSNFDAIYYKRITKELSDHYPVFSVLDLCN